MDDFFHTLIIDAIGMIAFVVAYIIGFNLYLKYKEHKTRKILCKEFLRKMEQRRKERLKSNPKHISCNVDILDNV